MDINQLIQINKSAIQQFKRAVKKPLSSFELYDDIIIFNFKKRFNGAFFVSIFKKNKSLITIFYAGNSTN